LNAISAGAVKTLDVIYYLVQDTGVESAYPAWEADILSSIYRFVFLEGGDPFRHAMVTEAPWLFCFFSLLLKGAHGQLTKAKNAHGSRGIIKRYGGRSL